MQALLWEVGDPPPPYLVGHTCFSHMAEQIIALQPDRIFIVADPTVAQLHGLRFQALLQPTVSTELLLVAEGEQHKTLKSLEDLASQALRCQVSRASVVVAMGGGLIGNIAGLLAALLFRGIRLVHIPTTLLAMHDSVSSLKQAVNCAGVKNILGTYYAPTLILADLAMLDTLPPAHIRSGLFELVKNGLLFGGSYFERVKRLIPCWHDGAPEVWLSLVASGVEAKNSILNTDSKERRHGIIFEFGHTIGHALELSWGDQHPSHGEAVAWGMLCANSIACKLGYMSEQALEQCNSLLYVMGPLQRPSLKPALDVVMEKVLRDNKRGYVEQQVDTVPMILLHRPGQVVGSVATHFLTMVPTPTIRNVLRELELVVV